MKKMNKLSAVITCFNNEKTIIKCVQSLNFASEIIVLDSFSTDKTCALLAQEDCLVHQQKFKGYSQQKQDAINLAANDWVLLLDSDEFFDKNSQIFLKNWMNSNSKFMAYELPRREWVFWQWSHRWVHKNTFVRLFNKKYAHVSNDVVHESIKSSKPTAKLAATINHFGETSISLKVEKINRYSQLSAVQKYKAGKTVHPIKLIFYPLWYFFRQYIIRRQIFNGWAGLINAILNSKYAFLKYAKLYELQKNKNQ
jgi:glycosyltransferase involved in cell wall biosynthesis